MENQIYQVIGALGVWFLETRLISELLKRNEKNARDQNLELPKLGLVHSETKYRSNLIINQKKWVESMLNIHIPKAIGLLAIGVAITDILLAEGRHTPALLTFGFLNLAHQYCNRQIMKSI